MKDVLRVLIADDHTLVRMGLKMLLEAADGFSVAGEAENGEEAVRLAEALKPDVVVMDLVMPNMSGADAAAELKRRGNGARILLLTTFANPEEIADALNSGAAGAMLKSSANTELLKAIRVVGGGGSYVSEELRDILSNMTATPQFTERQSQVLSAVTRGLSNREISVLLAISQERIKQHLNVIYAKLGAANRAEAVAIAMRHHLLKA